MFGRIITLIRAYVALPGAIQRNIFFYYLHRISFTRPSDHQVIWTSFYYFYAWQNAEVKNCPEGYCVRFEYRDKPLEVLIRKGKSSDVFVFFQVFIRDEYRPLFTKTDQAHDTIFYCLDAGANVGYFTLAMACWYENCRIILLEPDELNYTFLLKNMEMNRLMHRVTPLKAALWINDRTLTLINPSSVQEWSYSVTDKEAMGSACDGLSLGTLLRKTHIAGFNVVKIDIEGAEHLLFSDPEFLSHLQKADVVGVEVHGEAEQKEKILKWFDNRGFAVSQHGELTLSVKRLK